jgi:hypothetical protein
MRKTKNIFFPTIKYLILILPLLSVPSVAFSWTMTTHWNDLNASPGQNNSDGWNWNYGGASIDSSTNTPDPPNALRFTYPAGYPSGNAPDIVVYNFPSPTTELWYQ